MDSITTTTVKMTTNSGSIAINCSGVIVMANYSLTVEREAEYQVWRFSIADIEVSNTGCGKKPKITNKTTKINRIKNSLRFNPL